MEAEFLLTIDEPWLSIEPVRVGSIPPGMGTPDLYATVADSEKPILRIDVYRDHGAETFTFSNISVWRNWAVVGFGHRVHLVRLSDRRTLTFSLHDYFCHLYTKEDRLYASSGSRLFCIDPQGALLWTSDELGINGVEVTKFGAETIVGEGEWDPPGGWRPFEINVKNGKTIGTV